MGSGDFFMGADGLIIDLSWLLVNWVIDQDRTHFFPEVAIHSSSTTAAREQGFRKELCLT